MKPTRLDVHPGPKSLCPIGAALIGLLIAAFAHPSPAHGGQVDGFTEPYRTIHVAAAEPGIVARVSVGEGDRVRQGQLLATLDSDVLTASLRIAQAQVESIGRLAAARAEQKLCTTRLEKLRRLRADGHATQSELERAETDLEIARAKLLLAEEQRKIYALERQRIEAQIQRRKIRSPADGVVIKVHREQGEAVLAGDPTILTLVQLNPLRARLSVSAGQSAGLKVGQTVDVVFPETGRQARATVRIIAPVTDATSGTVSVTVDIDNSQGLYRSGVRCAVEIQDGPPAGAKLP